MHFSLPVGKARRPKFDLHLRIHDLNNVPLVSGSSYIKWHLTHSIHAEHRGRTAKCPIANHRVDYNYHKLIPGVRISLDKNNQLAECPIEFEILQEFAVAEKITLGHIRLNLSEYVEESESYVKDLASPGKRGTSSNVSPTSKTPAAAVAAAVGATGSAVAGATHSASHNDGNVEEGIVRRYLMQDSKINSTLRISILMVHVDGDRNYVAPALRTAPVFGGIAGLMAPEQAEDDIGPLPSVSKSRDQSEVQDLYRRTLAASWQRQPSELPADECIEDIFTGGNGWRTAGDSTSSSTSDVEDGNGGGHYDTIRASDFRRMNNHHHSSHYHHHHRHLHRHHHHRHHHHLDQPQQPPPHRRSNSASSDKSSTTVVGRSIATANSTTASSTLKPHHIPRHSRHSSRTSLRGGGLDEADEEGDNNLGRSRSGSLASMTPTLSSDRSREHGGLRHFREVHETEVRDDLVAWRLPGSGEATVA